MDLEVLSWDPNLNRVYPDFPDTEKEEQTHRIDSVLCNFKSSDFQFLFHPYTI